MSSPGPPPIPVAGGAASARARWPSPVVEVPPAVLEHLAATGAEVVVERGERVEASRDWWPLALTWALDGEVAQVAGAVVRPASVDQVAAVLAVCDGARVPVTPAGGRSGVCGGSVPWYGGVALDLRRLDGIGDVDDVSLVVDVAAGTYGDRFEANLRSRGLTCGHWPQSMALSTVGGWLACRGAGQLSTRYGKVEDMVAGLDVVLADGRVVHTGGAPRQAIGPDLDQLFVGSEGTLGVIVGARLRVHPAPEAEARAAYGFASFDEGLDACRRILRRGATPAVLRLYDPAEGRPRFDTGDRCPVIVLDEGDPGLVEATMAVVAEECRAAEPLPAELVGRWLAHRNDVRALGDAIGQGLVVDTMEVAGRWSALAGVHRAVVEATVAVPGVVATTAHLSHAYLDGGCLYFTFAAVPEAGGSADDRDRLYRDVWDAGTRAALAHGASLSHHHGVGANRGRFMREALGAGFDVLVAVKQALDPHGTLNPGKLGLPDPFGRAPFA